MEKIEVAQNRRNKDASSLQYARGKGSSMVSGLEAGVSEERRTAEDRGSRAASAISLQFTSSSLEFVLTPISARQRDSQLRKLSVNIHLVLGRVALKEVPVVVRCEGFLMDSSSTYWLT